MTLKGGSWEGEADMQVPDPGTLADVLVPIAGMLTGGALIVTVGWTIRHWVDRHYRSKELVGSDVLDTLGRIEQRLTNVEDLSERIQELEERLDFAERVLVKSGDRPVLPPREDG